MKNTSVFRYYLLLLFFCPPFLFSIQAQNATITGKVTTVEMPDGMPGVSVTVKGTVNGTTTNQTGIFSISNVPSNGILVFSAIGFKTQTIQVKGAKQVNVVLEMSEVSALDQVVVIGYGTTKKKDLTGAIASVNATQLQKEHPASIQDILRGNVVGLNVGFTASPKGDAGLQVRGRNTLTAGSSPLIVLDGIIYYGALADINPNDIETVDVLKDASSAAVYGAKAASGVIQITTKKGKTGKPTINVNSSVGMATMSVNESVYNAQDFLNIWRREGKYSTNINAQPYRFDDPRTLPGDISVANWLAYDNSSPTADPVRVWLQRLNLQPVEIENYLKNQSIDWYDMMFTNGIRQDYNVSLSGRREGINYYWAMGYMKNEGVIKLDDYNVVRSRLNLDAKITSFLSVGTNTQFSIRDESAVPVNWSLITSNSPWGSYYTDDSTQLRFNPNDEASGGNNPFGVPTYTNRLKKYYELNASLFAKITLPFNIRYQLNFTPRFQWYNYFNGESAMWQQWSNIGGRATRENRNIYHWQIDNLLSWSREFGKAHRVDITALINAEKFQVWRSKMTNSGFQPSDILSYHNMGAGTNPVISNTGDFSDETSTLGDEVSTADALMGRVHYSFKDRYMLTATVRRDGYSSFGQSNPRATFPSAALGWVFSDESFLQSATWLNFGKLRVSYGLNGNRDIGRYVALADLQTGKYLHVLQNGNIQQVSQLYVNNMQNKLLKWETTTAFNLGIDFSLFKRIDGSIDMYKSATRDLLVKRILPDVTGFDFIYDNLGRVENKGIEVTIHSKNIMHPNFSWSSTANFSLNRNKIASLYGIEVDIKDANGNITGKREPDDKVNRWFIGQPLDVIWNQRVLGVWQENEYDQAREYGVYPGDFKIKDVNNDKKYTDDDREFIGYGEPRFRWTIRNEFTLYKNFSLSFFLYSYWGQSTAFNQAKNRSNAFPDRVSSYAFPFWTPENPINDYARLASNDGSASYSIYRKRSFTRLDNISVAYNFPQSWLQKIKAQTLTIYFSVKNVAVYAPDWSFWDPEWASGSNPGPTPRMYTLGLNINL